MKYASLRSGCRSKGKKLVRVFVALVSLLAALPYVLAQEPQSSSRILTHPQSVNTLPAQSKRWALLIGVDRYEDSNIAPLSGAANDANSLKDVLVKHAG